MLRTFISTISRLFLFSLSASMNDVVKQNGLLAQQINESAPTLLKVGRIMVIITDNQGMLITLRKARNTGIMINSP